LPVAIKPYPWPVVAERDRFRRSVVDHHNFEVVSTSHSFDDGRYGNVQTLPWHIRRDYH